MTSETRPNDSPETEFKILDGLEFAIETAGITSCLFYLNAITTNINVFNIISLTIIGLFVAISATLLLRRCLYGGTGIDLQTKYDKTNFILFQIFGFGSLLTLAGYAYFFSSNPANGFSLISPFENSLHFTLIILAIALLGFFSNLSTTVKAYTSLNDSGFAISTKQVILLTSLNALFFSGFVTCFGLLYLNIISTHTFFLAVAGCCGAMAILTILNKCLFIKHLKNIRSYFSFPAYNLDECSNSSNSSSTLEQNVDPEDPDYANKLSEVNRQLIRSGFMSVFSFGLFGTAMGLMTVNNTAFHFASISLLFAGFILQLSSTAVGQKSSYYNLCDQFLSISFLL